MGALTTIFTFSFTGLGKTSVVKLKITKYVSHKILAQGFIATTNQSIHVFVFEFRVQQRISFKNKVI